MPDSYSVDDLLKLSSQTDQMPSEGQFFSVDDLMRISAGDEDIGYSENIGRGAAERGSSLAGTFTRFVGQTSDELADWLEQNIPLGQIEIDGDGIGWRPSTQEDIDAESPLLPVARDLEGADFGYEPGTTWEDVKDSPFKNVIPFAIEQGLVSTPDMAAVMLNLPAYVASRTGEIGQERAQNSDRKDATIEDFVKAAPASVASAFLERLGTRGIIGLDDVVRTGRDIPGAALKAGTKEAGTEAGQEAIEYAGETVGTNKEFELAEVGERALAGAVGGGPFGAGARAVTGSAQIALGKREQATSEVELSDDDRASPIPDDLIQSGKEIIADAEGSQSANDILARNNLPNVNEEVEIDFGDGRVEAGVIADAFSEENTELGIADDGVKILMSDGRVFEEFTGQIERLGINIRRVEPPAEGGTDEEIAATVQPAQETPPITTEEPEITAPIVEEAQEPVDQFIPAALKFVRDEKKSLNYINVGMNLGTDRETSQRILQELALRGEIEQTKTGGYRRKSYRSGPTDVITFIADRGGIRDDEGHDLKQGRNLQKFVPKAGPLIRSTGKGVDEIGESLWEAGYFGPVETTPRPSEDDVLQLIERAHGEKIYLPEETPQSDMQDQAGAQYLNQFENESEAGSLENALSVDLSIDEAMAEVYASLKQQFAEHLEEDEVYAPEGEPVTLADLETIDDGITGFEQSGERRSALGEEPEGTARTQEESVSLGEESRRRTGRESPGLEPPAKTESDQEQTPAPEAGVSDSEEKPEAVYARNPERALADLSGDQLKAVAKKLKVIVAKGDNIRTVARIMDKSGHSERMAAYLEVVGNRKADTPITETVQTVDGDREQSVIPGAEQFTEKENLERKSKDRKLADVAQETAGALPLFGGEQDTNVDDQTNLFDEKTKAAPAPVTESFEDLNDIITGNDEKKMFEAAEKRDRKLDALKPSDPISGHGKNGIFIEQSGNVVKMDVAGETEHVRQDLVREPIEEKSADESSEPYTVDRHEVIAERIRTGDINADELKSLFEQYRENEASLREELTKKTKKDLLLMMHPYERSQYKNEKKDRSVDSLVRSFAQDFHVSSDGITYSMNETMADAVAREVEKTTDEDIKAFAEDVAERRAASSARMKEIKKAIDNPETLEEFKQFARVKGEDKLTSEQQAKYDDLRAAAGRVRRKEAQEKNATIEGVEIGDVALEIIETTHTKKGHDLYVVQMSERVERDVYQDLNSKAKRLGGRYSSYARDGAVPGFQFRTIEAAEKFVSLKDGEVSKLDQIIERQKEVKGNAVERLRTMADDMEAKADESLNSNRKTNTARRVSMAASAEEKARAEKAMVTTMRNLAQAIEDGKATNLDGIRTRTHIEQLNSALNRAKYKWISAELKKDKTLRSEKLRDMPVSEEMIEFVEYPYPRVRAKTIRDLAKAAENVPGFKLIAKRLYKAAMAILREAEKGNGGYNMVFRNEQWRARLEKLLKGAERGEASEYTIENVQDIIKEFNRVRNMGIDDLPALRAALREFLQYRGQQAKADPTVQMERDLVGQKNIGIDFFPTTPELVERVMDEAQIEDGMKVLEPEAGKGDLADGAREAGGTVDTAELSGTLQEILEAKGHNIIGADFLEIEPEETYDRVVMNPPFSDRLDQEHVLHAFDFLKPGGRMVAIMGEGVFFGSDKKAVEFRRWLDEQGGVSEQLPEGSFKSSFRPTGVATRIVTIDKSGGKFSLTKPRTKGIPKEANPPISTFKSDAGIKKHEDYEAAKSGDTPAAARLVADLVTDENIAEAQERFGSDVVYIPVLAEEAKGKNKIPLLLARFYAESTRATVEAEVFQTNRAYHTGARPLERIMVGPIFEGTIEEGKKYVIVDDVTVMGGTIAEISSHIQENGGEVVGVVTLANASRTGVYNVKPVHLKLIEGRYGDELRTEFGIEPAALTAAEAGYILGFRDADALRAGIAKARDERSRRLRQKGIRSPETEDGRLRVSSKSALQSAFSHEFDAIQKTLEKQLKQYGLAEKIGVQLVSKIKSYQSGEVTGAEGRYLNRLIDIALGAENKDWVLDHEVIHALKELGVLRSLEWKALEKAALADTGRMTEIRRRYADQNLSEEALVEEAVADMFADWRANRAQPGGPLKRAFNRAVNFFKALGQALSNNGFNSVDDIFESIESGEIGRRSTQAISPTGETKFSISATKTKGGITGLYAEKAQGILDAIHDKVGYKFDPLGALPNKKEFLTKRYLTAGKIAAVDDTVASLYDTLKKASPEDAKAAYEYLTTKGASADSIQDEGIRSMARATKAKIDQIGSELVHRGLLDEKTYKEHAGEYLPRIYLKHLLGEEGIRAIGSGKKPSELGYLKRRKDIDEETRMLILGQITDPAFLGAQGIGKPMRDIAILDFLDEISQHEEWVYPNSMAEWRGKKVSAVWLRGEARRLADMSLRLDDGRKAETQAISKEMGEVADGALDTIGDVPENYKAVPETPRYGMLGGLLVRKEIYDDMIGSVGLSPESTNFAEDWLGVGGKGTKVTQLWKMSKVALNPPSQIRNFVSNAILLQLSGVPFHRVPDRMLSAISDIRSNGKHWRIAKKYGVTSGTFAANELHQVHRQVADLKFEHGGAWGKISKVGSIIAEKAGDFYQMSESIFKTAKIIDAMEREGKSESDAVLAAQEALFDYSLVPPSVRYARNAPFGMPFLTFYFKAIPQMGKAAIQHPERFLPYIALMGGMEMLLEELFDVDDEDFEALKKALPRWLHEKGHAMILPFKDEKGRWQVVDLGYFFPWVMATETVSHAIKGDISETTETLGLFGGLISGLVIATKTNVDPFTKRSITDPLDPPAKRFQDLIKYMWRLSAPTWITDVGPVGIPYVLPGKIETAIRGTPKRDGAPGDTLAQASLRMLGVNVYPVEPERSRAKNLKFMRYELLQIKAKITRAKKDQRYSVEQRKHQVSQFTELLRDKKIAMIKYAKESKIHPNLRTE